MKLKQNLFTSMLLAFAWSQAALGGENQQRVDPSYLLPAASRKFTIEYVARVPAVPPETKKLRVWLPAPQDSTLQTISELSFSPEARLTTEPKYGNRIAYWELENPAAHTVLTMKFACARLEARLDLARLNADGEDAPASFTVFRGPDALVTVDGEVRALARRVTLGKVTTLEKARAIYDYVLESMSYDKNHPGWGLGSTRHACDAGKGNCTDFHALFNSLCRAQGIASGFEIGLYLPYERDGAEPLGGYHCWAFFLVPGKTWVPVDCSEADRFPERKQLFFGGHTSNRVTLSTGRDLILEPRQAGPPLNYFLNPYAEADGKAVPAEKSWTFKDTE